MLKTHSFYYDIAPVDNSLIAVQLAVNKKF